MQESSHHQFRREKVGEQKVSDSCVYHGVAASAYVHLLDCPTETPHEYKWSVKCISVSSLIAGS